MTAPEAPPDAPETGAGILPARHRRARRTQRWAYGVSAAVHLLAIALYPLLFGGLPDGPPTGPRAPDPPPEGIEIVNLLESETAPAEVPPEPRQPTERQPVPTPERPPVVDPSEDEPPADASAVEAASSRTAAERLEPRIGDERLWVSLPEEITALTDEQQLENLLYARIIALQDSLAALGAVGPDLDWTHTDSDGNKWGISPGKLHLGPITIPMPSFAAPMGGTSADLQRRLWIEDQIRRAAGQLRNDETVEERARAIRERRDEERRRRNNPPDTTRGGGRR